MLSVIVITDFFPLQETPFHYTCYQCQLFPHIQKKLVVPIWLKFSSPIHYFVAPRTNFLSITVSISGWQKGLTLLACILQEICWDITSVSFLYPPLLSKFGSFMLLASWVKGSMREEEVMIYQVPRLKTLNFGKSFISASFYSLFAV